MRNFEKRVDDLLAEANNGGEKKRVLLYSRDGGETYQGPEGVVLAVDISELKKRFEVILIHVTREDKPHAEP